MFPFLQPCRSTSWWGVTCRLPSPLLVGTSLRFSLALVSHSSLPVVSFPLLLLCIILSRKGFRRNPRGILPHEFPGEFSQWTAEGASGKGPRQKNQNRQKVSNYFRHFSTFFAQGKKVKNRQKVSKIFSTLFDNFRAAPVFRPLLGGPNLGGIIFFVTWALFFGKIRATTPPQKLWEIQISAWDIASFWP